MKTRPCPKCINWNKPAVTNCAACDSRYSGYIPAGGACAHGNCLGCPVMTRNMDTDSLWDFSKLPIACGRKCYKTLFAGMGKLFDELFHNLKGEKKCH